MLPDEVREAVDALYQRAHESGVFFYMPTNAEARDTIRAHLLAREAEVKRLRAIEKERWDVVATRNAAVMRAERAEATLREIRDSTHKSALMLRAMADRCITAHLSENSRG